MGQDRFTCTFPFSVTFIYGDEFAKEKKKVDLLHVVLLSFLFQDMPGLWPLPKNRVY